MDSISPIGANRSAERAGSSSPADVRRALFEAASSTTESSNGERNAQATGRFAVQQSSRIDGVGDAIARSATGPVRWPSELGVSVEVRPDDEEPIESEAGDPLLSGR